MEKLDKLLTVLFWHVDALAKWYEGAGGALLFFAGGFGFLTMFSSPLAALASWWWGLLISVFVHLVALLVYQTETAEVREDM